MLRQALRGTCSLLNRASRGIPAVLILSLATAAPSFAATLTMQNTSDVVTNLCGILNWMFWISLCVSIIMVLYAAYLYVFAQDDAEQVTTAKRAIFYAAIGIIVALAAKGFPSLVGSVFGQSVSTC
jgi:amino acid permease